MEALYVAGAARLPYDAPAQVGRDTVLAAYRTSFASRTYIPTIVLEPLEFIVFGARALERGPTTRRSPRVGAVFRCTRTAST
ncbi:MAG: hypothetical protein ACRDGN_00890 [bacterium]